MADRFRTAKTELILIGGKAGVGKTTAANYMHEVLSSYKELRISHTAFAKPIKDIALLFGWDGKKDEKGRRLLQVLGTDAGRAYDENIWVDIFEKLQQQEVYPNNIVLVDDWRFPNEKEFFLNKPMFNVTSIRIERSGIRDIQSPTTSHPSEISLGDATKENISYNPNAYYNFSIFNDGTIDELKEKLEQVLLYIVTSKLIEY